MRIRICSKCGKHNLETAWSCANCGESLSVYTITELDDESVELHTPVENVQRQQSVSSETPAAQATSTNVISPLTSTERFVLYLVAKGVQDTKNPTIYIAQALNISLSKALDFQENLRKKIGGATNREMILLAKEKGYHLISQQPEDEQLWDWADQLDELTTVTDDVRQQEAVSNRSRPEPEKNWESVKRSKLSDTWAVPNGIEYRRRHGFFTALLIFYFIGSILSIIFTMSVMPIASILGVVQLAAVVAIWYWKRWGIYVYYTLAVVGFVSNVLVGLPTFLWIIWLVSFGLFVFFSANQWNDFE